MEEEKNAFYLVYRICPYMQIPPYVSQGIYHQQSFSSMEFPTGREDEYISAISYNYGSGNSGHKYDFWYGDGPYYPNYYYGEYPYPNYPYYPI